MCSTATAAIHARSGLAHPPVRSRRALIVEHRLLIAIRIRQPARRRQRLQQR